MDGSSPTPELPPERPLDPPSRPTAEGPPLPLAAAIQELLFGLRAGAADVADLVAAEAHLALRLLIAMVLSAVAAIVLAVFALATLVGALASELIDHGVSPTLAMLGVAVLCFVGCAALVFELRQLSRRALFGRSRSRLRGES